MNKTLSHQVIALAAAFQALSLVQDMARRGHADHLDMTVCIRSVLKVDSDDVLDVYGGLAGLRTGLMLLDRQITHPGRVNPELLRYLSVLMSLERQVMARPELLKAISASIQNAALRAELASSVLDDTVFEALAAGYQNSLSTLDTRVMVSGEPGNLSNPLCANRIRALLLAALRSLVLWRQCGGVRWKLLFIRWQMQREVRRLLQSI